MGLQLTYVPGMVPGAKVGMAWRPFMDTLDWLALAAGAAAWATMLGTLLVAALLLDVKARRRNETELP